MARAQTRYAKTADGVHIAYQVRGSGSADVVWIPAFVSNFEVELEQPEMAAVVAAPLAIAIGSRCSSAM